MKNANQLHNLPTTGQAISTISSNINHGKFGHYGGRIVPEILMQVITEVTDAFAIAIKNEAYLQEINELQTHYTGRPSPVYLAKNLTKAVGGATIVLKREDLNHTGSHKINNVLGQLLLAKRMKKTRIIAETGAGQHGVATATVSALLGFKCVIYMGKVDMERQKLNVARMKLLGAEVVSVDTGSATLKDAINEAMRDWVTNANTTYYCFGTAAGPHPFPYMVHQFQRIISVEARQQLLNEYNKLPVAAIACVGGGSNAIGLFSAFLTDPQVRLIGCEAAGSGVDTGKHAATLTAGRLGAFQGSLSYLLQDADGQTIESHSISAGLDYPGVGPEHAYLKDTERAEYMAITDSEAMLAFGELSRLEGILPAIESAHAIAGAIKLAKEYDENDILLVNLSGRGDKDVTTAGKWFGVLD